MRALRCLRLHVLLVGFAALAGCAFDGRSEPARITVDGGASVAPLRIDGGTPVVPVVLDAGEGPGRGPYWFVVDTGSTLSVVSARVAREVGLRTRSRYGRIDTGSGARLMSMPTAHVESLAVGSARFEDFDVIVRDLDHVGAVSGVPLDGIIGQPLILPLLWTIDFPGRSVRIERGELPEPDDAEVHGFMSSGGTPSLTVRVDELLLQAEVDTGMSSPVELGPEDVRRLGERVRVTGRVGGVRLDGAETTPSGVLEGRVTIGKYGLVRPEVLLGRTTTLGSGAFLATAVSIDGRNQRVRIVPSSSAGPAPDEADRGAEAAGPEGSGPRARGRVHSAPAWHARPGHSSPG